MGSFFIMHTDGSADDDPALDALDALYDELAIADREHGDVAVTRSEDGWTLSAHRDRRVVFEKLGEPNARHMIPVGRTKILALWKMMIAGDFAALEREPWCHGYVADSHNFGTETKPSGR